MKPYINFCVFKEYARQRLNLPVSPSFHSVEHTLKKRIKNGPGEIPTPDTHSWRTVWVAQNRRFWLPKIFDFCASLTMFGQAHSEEIINYGPGEIRTLDLQLRRLSPYLPNKGLERSETPEFLVKLFGLPKKITRLGYRAIKN